MLQIAVYNAVDTYRITHTGNTRHQGTIATYQQFDRYTVGGSLIEFLYHSRIRDMVYLDKDISRFARLLVLDFIVYQLYKLLLHLIGRNQQFFETHR